MNDMMLLNRLVRLQVFARVTHDASTVLDGA